MSRDSFLREQDCSEHSYSLIGEDWGPRRYFRIPLKANNRTAILMESVADNAPESMPGHKISDFLRIGRALRAAGLHAPEIMAAREEEGLVLLEDLGGVRFYDALERGEEAAPLYRLATDVLVHLRKYFLNNTLNLPLYKDSHIHEGRRRVVDWYLPMALKRKNPAGLVQEYLAVWTEIEQNLPSCPQGFVHGDYHAQNLMWLPQETGLNRCGILDFQGALWGPLPYDLVNLAEDIRRDVPEDIRDDMMARYTQGMDGQGREAFSLWYRVIGTQFHCRVIGQVLKLALKGGKTAPLKNLPGIQAYLRAGLEYPVLRPLKDWFGGQGVDFNEALDLSDKFVSPDAF